MNTTLSAQIIQVILNYCINHKKSLAARLVKISNLNQFIVCQVLLQTCKGYTGVGYRSPSQDNINFENFLSDIDEPLSKNASPNSLFTIILVDFNAGNSSWRKEDKTYIRTHKHYSILVSVLI